MPGRLLVTKVANALIPDASPTTELSLLLPLVLVLRLYRKFAGGLWVGGTLSLYEDCLRFEANAANRLMHAENHVLEIALLDVRAVELRSAFVTNIVDVTHGTECFSFRAFGARKLVTTIQTAVTSAHRKPLDKKGSIKIN